jgi:hypothetical protein
MMDTCGPKHVVVVNSIPPTLSKSLVVFMTVVNTYFYIVADTQRGCRTLKKISQVRFSSQGLGILLDTCHAKLDVVVLRMFLTTESSVI